MSELDRQRAELVDLREDFEEHKAKSDEALEEIREHMRYLRDFADQVLAYMQVDTKDHV